ncbi:MAG TPA: hypothetical protein VNJ12_03915 [Candidatus Dormibacteraeota bacterium]|nr:hypothetical protein [Candidatus Dormibacteraeota bacterium]
MINVTKKKTTKKEPEQQALGFSGDGRRKHRHWEVTIQYHDGKTFARVYTDRTRAERFAERQNKSPIVRSTKIREV